MRQRWDCAQSECESKTPVQGPEVPAVSVRSWCHRRGCGNPWRDSEMKRSVNAFPDSGNSSAFVGKNWTWLTQSEHLKLQNVTKGVQRLDRKLVVFERPAGKDDPRRAGQVCRSARERFPQLAKLLVAGSHRASRHRSWPNAVPSPRVRREIARIPWRRALDQPPSNA